MKSVVDRDFDLIVTVEPLPPRSVEELRRRRVPVVLWYPDHIGNLGPMWLFASPYTAVFLKEPVLVRRARAYGFESVHYLPEACLASVHRPTSGDFEDVVVLAGSLYPWRLRIVERLERDGVPLALYGPVPGLGRDNELIRRNHRKEYLRGSRKSQVFRNCAAVVNTMHPAEIDGVNKRLFEAAASGACVISEDRATLGDHFARGTEVATFGDYTELINAIEWARCDRAAAVTFGDAAAIRAARDHDYRNRLDVLLNVAMGRQQ